jgi:hypothetical protein
MKTANIFSVILTVTFLLAACKGNTIPPTPAPIDLPTEAPMLPSDNIIPTVSQTSPKCEMGLFWGISIPTAPSSLRYVYQLHIRYSSGISEISTDEVNIRNRFAESCNVMFDVKHTFVSTDGVVTNDYSFEKQNPSFIFWKEFPYEPLPSELRVGDSVNDRFETYIYKIVAIETITVPAGTFNTYRLESIQNNQAKFIIWISKGIGVVKMEKTFGNGDSKAVELMEFSGTGQSSSSTFNEAQVRYILADSQFGSIDYYRQFLDQPAVAEAVRRWDAGVRVTNINQFERKIVGDKGWQIVYVGTDTLINGMDVRLTTDP